MSTDRSRLLAHLSSALARASTDLPGVLAAAAAATSATIGDFAAVQVVDDDVLSPAVLAGPVPRRTGADEPVVVLRADEGLSGRLAATGRPIVNNAAAVEQIAAGVPSLRGFLDGSGTRALMLLPLIADGSYLGLIAVGRRVDRPFLDADVVLGTDIAASVALAVAAAQSVRRLQTSEDRYRRIVETSLDGMWEGDRDARTTFVNERTTQMLGYTRAQMMGQPLARFLDEQNSQGVPGRLAARLIARPKPYEIQLIRADGTRLWVEANAVALPDDDAGATGFFGTFIDISDRVRARDLQAQLDRVHRLDSLGQLAGGVAHNFNNLLTVISGCSQLLLDAVPADEVSGELVAEIAGAAEKGRGLCRELLAFGRSQPGVAEPLDLHVLLTDLAGLLRLTVGDHIHVVLPRTPDPDEPGAWVTADRGHLEQVIINLAANAREAMVEAGTLTVECDRTLGIRRESRDVDTRDEQDAAQTHSEDARWYVRLSVTDTGCGMDPETLRRAFEPFFTTKESHRGTGLGLAGVYGTVRQAGGVVNLRSQPGAGTVAEVYLPATDIEPRSQRTGTAPLTAAAYPARRGGHGRLLLVEDEPAVERVVNRLLTEAGYVVTAPGAAEDALQAVRDGLDVDLLITDVMMPMLTGPELSRRVHDVRPGLPILFISGYTAGALDDIGRLDLGMALLEKPFTREALLDAVSRLLGR